MNRSQTHTIGRPLAVQPPNAQRIATGIESFDLTALCDLALRHIERNLTEPLDLQVFCGADPVAVAIDRPRFTSLIKGLYFLLAGSLNCGGTLTLTTSLKTPDELKRISRFFAQAKPHVAITLEFILDRNYRHGLSLQKFRNTEIFSRRLAQLGKDAARLGGVIQPPITGQWSLASTLFLPVDDAPANSEPPVKADTPASRYTLNGTETLLIVDDDDDVRRATAAMLRRFGYTVLEAANGLEAEMTVMEREGAIDLVMLDVIMPDKHGCQVFMELRQLFPELGVVLCSGYARDEAISRIIVQDGVDFIAKPYNHNELLTTIRRTLDA